MFYLYEVYREKKQMCKQNKNLDYKPTNSYQNEGEERSEYIKLKGYF